MIETLKIDITEQDISDGVPGDPVDCAGGKACHRALTAAGVDVEDLNIDCSTLCFDDPDGCWEAAIPSDLSQFIIDFDYQREVKPGSYELKISKFADPDDDDCYTWDDEWDDDEIDDFDEDWEDLDDY